MQQANLSQSEAKTIMKCDSFCYKIKWYSLQREVEL